MKLHPLKLNQFITIYLFDCCGRVFYIGYLVIVIDFYLSSCIQL